MKGAAIYCPARIDEKTFKEAQELARRTYIADELLWYGTR